MEEKAKTIKEFLKRPYVDGGGHTGYVEPGVINQKYISHPTGRVNVIRVLCDAEIQEIAIDDDDGVGLSVSGEALCEALKMADIIVTHRSIVEKAIMSGIRQYLRKMNFKYPDTIETDETMLMVQGITDAVMRYNIDEKE